MLFKKEADKLYSTIEGSNEEGKEVFYKKRKVYPILNRDGSLNWFNLLTGGTWWKLILALGFTIVVIGMIYEYHANLQTCVEVMARYNGLTKAFILQ